ncbi:MAG TPA: PAS domain-containing protein, partial [Stellaceae bacterium]|nr:PAS domain-containing protein [Stellaceae bacterium]
MVADSAGTRRGADWGGEPRRPGRLALLANLVLILITAALGAAILFVAHAVSGADLWVAATALVALAAVVGVAAGAARWMHGALVGRLDILSQALDASPDAQLLLGPDGRVAYANTAFHDLFPPSGEAPLERIVAALPDAESQGDFARLRERAAAGGRAIAALPLRDSRGGAAGWFNVAVNPIAGRPGYSFWNIQDDTARHEMEAMVRDERNELVDFL